MELLHQNVESVTRFKQGLDSLSVYQSDRNPSDILRSRILNIEMEQLLEEQNRPGCLNTPRIDKMLSVKITAYRVECSNFGHPALNSLF